VSARILVIEDNPANLELMSYLLTAYGHTVLTATDGREGIECARRERPHLIVCDVQLPHLDGYEVARWLKSDPALRTIPLVAVTALAMVGDRERVLAAGFDGYLAKPINPELFVRQMENYIRPGQRSTPAAHTSPSAPPLVDKGAERTILVVDNLSVNLELARSILEPSGYKVLTAEGMTEGLAIALSEPCDLILSDVCMADGTGYDFLQVVLAEPQLQSIPFVLITSTMVEEKDRARGLKLGATRFLVRPIEPEAFLAEIRACLTEMETRRTWQSS
jgi:two-component system cell cycle response regulator